MALQEACGPFEGTMSIVYRCQACDYRMAMLTNQMETQMVRSLGVKIGGRAREAAPMETLRTNLQGKRQEVAVPDRAKSASKCPFTGVVTEALEASQLQWTAGAQARMARVPAFVRPMVQRNVEDYAAQSGKMVVDESVIDAMKGQLGI